MKFVWLDDAYPNAYAQWKDKGGPWAHGTANFWDHALEKFCHESVTLLANAYAAQNCLLDDARAHDPDVVCCQNVGRWNAELLRAHFPNSVLIGFSSYATAVENLLGWDMLFTSFQWRRDELVYEHKANCEYMPLAFGGQQILDWLEQYADRMPSCIKNVCPLGYRPIDFAFFGGLGYTTWKQGTDTMAEIAELLPEFKWWGYWNGPQEMPSSLRRSYQGEAWGLDYWFMLSATEIVVNRHGEIARGQPRQNMREWESPGCGAYLMSDTTDNQGLGCTNYKDAKSAVSTMKTLIHRRETIRRNAMVYQKFILSQGCYEHRVPQLLATVAKAQSRR